MLAGLSLCASTGDMATRSGSDTRTPEIALWHLRGSQHPLSAIADNGHRKQGRVRQSNRSSNLLPKTVCRWPNRRMVNQKSDGTLVGNLATFETARNR